MSPYRITHLPYGLTDPSKRFIRNPGIKDECQFLKYGIETDGEYFYARTLVRGGGGVPIHRHYTYGETMRPFAGDIGLIGHNGTKTMVLRSANNPAKEGNAEPWETLKKGSPNSYTVVPGEWHRFFNPSPTEPFTFDAKVLPAHQGFEKVLYIYYGLVEDGHGDELGQPKSLFHALMLMNMGEVGYPGVIGWLCGLLAGIVGWIARASGEEERLTRKYYGKPVAEATAEERRKWVKKDL